MQLDRSHTVLRVEDVSFSYHSSKSTTLNVLHDINLTIQSGEFLCLLGPSGCGKTTLLRLIAGLDKPSSGVITFPAANGNTPKVGMVFQDLALFPHMSVARNIGYALRHLSRKERHIRTDDMLQRVGLSDKRGNYPHELSGGQKQRLALARALARQPDIILLDEPFAAQDITLRAQMRDEVIHILREAGIAALLVTHDPEEAMQFADRIAIMNKGRIEQIGSPADIYSAPQNAFVASFFGQVNILRGHVQSGHVITPLGPIPAPDFDENSPVQVIIRPEGLNLRAHDHALDSHENHQIHTHATISEKKYLGRSTLVHIDTYSLDNTHEPRIHLHARMPGIYSDREQSVQDVLLDPTHIFIFKDEAA